MTHRNTSENHPCAIGSIGPTRALLGSDDTETKTLHLIVDLTGIVDKLLDRVTELERKTKRLEQVVDRLREFAPNLGMEVQ